MMILFIFTVILTISVLYLVPYSTIFSLNLRKDQLLEEHLEKLNYGVQVLYIYVLYCGVRVDSTNLDQRSFYLIIM